MGDSVTKRSLPESAGSIRSALAKNSAMEEIDKFVREIIESVVSERQDERDKRNQAEVYLCEISESRARARKIQVEINRLKKKTQLVIDKLQ